MIEMTTTSPRNKRHSHVVAHVSCMHTMLFVLKYTYVYLDGFITFLLVSSPNNIGLQWACFNSVNNTLKCIIIFVQVLCLD